MDVPLVARLSESDGGQAAAIAMGWDSSKLKKPTS
jgi:hypothetical protein